MDRKRIVHTLDTPYTAVEWPEISQEDQDAILELLCQLLSPIGSHRRSFITPSKGKRKRSKQVDARKPEDSAKPTEPPSPPAPEISAYIDVGLAQITRQLQAQAQAQAQAQRQGQPNPIPPSSSSNPASSTNPETSPAVDASSPATTKPYTVVFIARSPKSPVFHSHFPSIVAVASSSQTHPSASTTTTTTTTTETTSTTTTSSGEPIRLVGFSKAGVEDRLSAALGLPRASCIALREGAPRAEGLVKFVRERVKPVEMKWLEEARKGEFRETKIAAVPTKIGAKKVRMG
ncbi:hypothetical protein VTJ04DRAFT_658 [Mycothermus thermophilus]|uniref:uncharacterized protein n=1 Tax=Humicola insolens TaxID=85995 RepID=UPI003744510F